MGRLVGFWPEQVAVAHPVLRDSKVVDHCDDRSYKPDSFHNVSSSIDREIADVWRAVPFCFVTEAEQLFRLLVQFWMGSKGERR